MNVVLSKLPDLAAEELIAAYEKYGPFASTHEGYAVILEEVEEATTELNVLKAELQSMWYEIRHDAITCACDSARKVENRAIRLAAEAIQVAAMAAKFQRLDDGEREGMRFEHM